MAVKTAYLHVSTQGNAQVINVTEEVAQQLSISGLKSGIVTVSVVGSTGAMTTCEFEPGLVQDIPELMDKLIPAGRYHHDETWNDGNGHSHLRASLVGPSVTIPFVDGALALGPWQQLVFIDFDHRSRQRELVVQMVGE
ncbi:MAG TPA: secondary thiamine-phosphate synthase enzyme YjbQ [Candidatus Bathyarchaeia archaeon]|nr:secondary thiamine-phosphate synthase enzyme YjbQ [Candidatus Bathyarchaeia archaeon]